MAKDAIPKPVTVSRRLTTVLVTDLCGYSALCETDEPKALALTDRAYSQFQKIVTTYHGRVFNRIADAFLAEFPSTFNAVDAGLEFLETLENLDTKVKFRMGIHVGDVTDRPDGDIFGHGVNIASRLQEIARPGAILISHNVRNLIEPNQSFHFQNNGQITLKNIETPMMTYVVSKTRQSVWQSLKGRIQKLRRYRALILGVVACAAIIGYVTHKTQSRQASPDQIIASYFSQNPSQSEYQGYSPEYLNYVLRYLKDSAVDSERATFELLRAGNISGAIENLEAYRRQRLSSRQDSMDFYGDEHIDLMHQIAALSYHHDPTKASSYFKNILQARPDDMRAKIWLARAQNQKGESRDAAHTEALIDPNTISDPKDRLQRKLDNAFTYLLNHDFETGAIKLFALEPDVTALGDARMKVEWQMNLAIALERLNRLDEAEALVSDVVATLIKIGADTNMPRAYNVWGQIVEKRAYTDGVYDVATLLTALEKYERQFEYGESLNKETEISEALHYMGAANLALGNLSEAKQNYAFSQQLAEDLGIVRAVTRAQIGLAVLHLRAGETDKACAIYLQVQQKITDHKIPLRPRNAQLLKELESSGC